MVVMIPTPLRDYTSGASEVSASGASLAEVLDQLDGRYPGIRFRMVDEQDRIRPHIKFFVGQELAPSLEGVGNPFAPWNRASAPVGTNQPAAAAATA